MLWNPQDFFYTCDTHLTDPGFATAIEPDPANQKVTLNEDDLKKIKDEWEERQKKNKEEKEAKEKEKEKEKKGKESTSGLTSWVGWATGSGSPSSSTPSPDPSKKPQLSSLFSAPGATPSHQKFILHRQIFMMRQTAFRKKRQVSQANAIAPRLPIVPSNLS